VDPIPPSDLPPHLRCNSAATATLTENGGVEVYNELLLTVPNHIPLTEVLRPIYQIESQAKIVGSLQHAKGIILQLEIRQNPILIANQLKTSIPANVGIMPNLALTTMLYSSSPDLSSSLNTTNLPSPTTYPTQDDDFWQSPQKSWHWLAVEMPEAWTMVNPALYGNLKMGAVEFGYTPHLDMGPVNWNILSNDSADEGNQLHGLWVLGALNAQGNNGRGVTGGLKGQAQSYMYQTSTRSIACVAETIHQAAKDRIQVLNMSLGIKMCDQGQSDDNLIAYVDSLEPLYDIVLDQALTAGTFLTVSAGNGITYCSDGRFSRALPAKAALPARLTRKYANLIAVGAHDGNFEKAMFSNYGSDDTPVVFGPGQNIYGLGLNNNYAVLSGTSMSSPVVGAIAGLLIAEFSGIQPWQVKEALLKSAERWTASGDPIVNAPNALRYAQTQFFPNHVFSGVNQAPSPTPEPIQTVLPITTPTPSPGQTTQPSLVISPTMVISGESIFFQANNLTPNTAITVHYLSPNELVSGNVKSEVQISDAQGNLSWSIITSTFSGLPNYESLGTWTIWLQDPMKGNSAKSFYNMIANNTLQKMTGWQTQQGFQALIKSQEPATYPIIIHAQLGSNGEPQFRAVFQYKPESNPNYRYAYGYFLTDEEFLSMDQKFQTQGLIRHQQTQICLDINGKTRYQATWAEPWTTP